MLSSRRWRPSSGGTGGSQTAPQMLTAPGERRIVGNGEVETHYPEQRVQEPFGLVRGQKLGRRVFLFQRAVGSDPLGARLGVPIASRPPSPSGCTMPWAPRMSVISWLSTLRPTRLRAYASATALPRTPQGSLPGWVGRPSPDGFRTRWTANKVS